MQNPKQTTINTVVADTARKIIFRKHYCFAVVEDYPQGGKGYRTFKKRETAEKYWSKRKLSHVIICVDGGRYTPETVYDFFKFDEQDGFHIVDCIHNESGSEIHVLQGEMDVHGIPLEQYDSVAGVWTRTLTTSIIVFANGNFDLEDYSAGMECFRIGTLEFNEFPNEIRMLMIDNMINMDSSFAI